MAEHAVEVPDTPAAALAAVARAAELWGAEFERQGTAGRLYLPVIAGLRRGLVAGPVEAAPSGDGTRVVFRPDEHRYYVHVPAVVILLLSVFGALLAVLWPFYPQLLPVAAFGVVLALGGWFLVISRLRTSGPDEFLDMVAGVLGEDPHPPAPSPASPSPSPGEGE
jgi:hypothetical protein